MQPILFHLGPVAVYSFGVFIALGFLAGGFVAYRLAKRAGLATRNFIDYFLYAAVAGLIGARVWHLAFKPSQVHSLWQVFSLWGGGLSLQGGLAAAGLTLWFLLRRAGEPVLRWFDVLTIGLTVGLVIGKVGSFLNGDSFGRTTKLPWGVKFDDPLAPGYLMGSRLHPLQLYAAILFAALAFLLWRRYRRQLADGHRPRAGYRDGDVFLRGLFGLSLIQFLLEFLHAPIDSLYVNGVRVVSVVAFGAMLGSGYFLWRRSRRRGAAAA